MKTPGKIGVGLCVALLLLNLAATGARAAGGAAVPPAKPSPDAFSDEEWTAHNLYYGPLEILMSPMMLFIGPAAYSSGWSNYPYVEKDTKPANPLTMAGGAALGLGMGLIMVPAVLLKGVFDTLTGGAWANSGFIYDVTL